MCVLIVSLLIVFLFLHFGRQKMASNLTDQVRSITQVTKAVALGDLSHLVEVDAHGEMLDLKDTVNAMVTHLSTLANEVSRVSLEVVTEGMLGGQAFVPDMQGMWKAMTDHVNNMSMLLTNQVRGISEVIKAIAWGDLTMRVEFNARGEMLELKETVNDTAELLRVFMDEVTRVARVAGAEGHLGWQAKVPNMAGSWKELADSVNVMANNVCFFFVFIISLAFCLKFWLGPGLGCINFDLELIALFFIQVTLQVRTVSVAIVCIPSLPSCTVSIVLMFSFCSW